MQLFFLHNRNSSDGIMFLFSVPRTVGRSHSLSTLAWVQWSKVNSYWRAIQFIHNHWALCYCLVRFYLLLLSDGSTSLHQGIFAQLLSVVKSYVWFLWPSLMSLIKPWKQHLQNHLTLAVWVNFPNWHNKNYSLAYRMGWGSYDHAIGRSRSY